MEDKMENNHVKKDTPLRGKVAQILTERELIINIGSTHGVRSGMKFKILADAPLEVRDPETHDVIGEIDREKVVVMASEIEERFTVCKTYKKWSTGGAGFAAIANIMMAVPQQKHETLKIEDSSLPLPLSEEESYVKVGDRAVQLVDEENDE